LLLLLARKGGQQKEGGAVSSHVTPLVDTERRRREEQKRYSADVVDARPDVVSMRFTLQCLHFIPKNQKLLAVKWGREQYIVRAAGMSSISTMP